MFTNLPHAIELNIKSLPFCSTAGKHVETASGRVFCVGVHGRAASARWGSRSRRGPVQGEWTGFQADQQERGRGESLKQLELQALIHAATLLEGMAIYD